MSVPENYNERLERSRARSLAYYRSVTQDLKEPRLFCGDCGYRFRSSREWTTNSSRPLHFVCRNTAQCASRYNRYLEFARRIAPRFAIFPRPA